MNISSSENHIVVPASGRNQPDRDITRVTIVFTIVIAALQVIGSLYPVGMLWGVHSFGFLSPPFLLGYLILTGAGLLYCAKGNIMQPLTALTRFMDRKPVRFLVLSCVLFIVTAVLLRIRVSLLGDSYTFLNNIENTLHGDHSLDLANEPIALSFYFMMAKILGATSEPEIMNAVFIGELFLGCGFIIATYFTVSTVFQEKGDIRKVLAFLYLGATPYMQVFFGYAESYAVVLFMLSCTILVMLLYFKHRTPFWLVMPVFVVQFFTHYMGTLLFPLVMYCAWCEYKEKSLSHILFGVLSAAITVCFVLAIGGFHAERFIRQNDHGHFLSLFGTGGQYDAYTFFSPFHVLDLINILFLMVPGSMLLIVLGYSRIHTIGLSRLQLSLLCAIVPFIVFLLFMKFDLGMAKDWDVTAPYFYVVSLFALIFFLRDFAPARVRSMCMVLVATILPSCGFFQMNATESASVRRTASLMDHRIMPQSGFFQTSFHLSMYYVYQHEPDSMIAIWKQYTAQFPADTRGYAKLAKSYWETGERSYDAIIQTYEQWLRIDPNDTSARNDYANFCVVAGISSSNNGHMDDAIARYSRAITLNPHLTAAYNNLGLIYHQQGSLDMAMSYYRKSIVTDAAYARGYKNLASAYVATGHPDSALPYFHKAIELDPRYTGAYEQLAVVSEMLGHENEAITFYRQAARLGSIPAQQYLTSKKTTW